MLRVFIMLGFVFADFAIDFLLGVFSYRTGVDNDDIRLFVVAGFAHPGKFKIATKHLFIPHVSLAAKGFYEIFATFSVRSDRGRDF